MNFSAHQLAQIVSGTVEGDPNRSISNFAKIEEAQQDCITFFHHPKYAKYLNDTQAGIILVNEDFDHKVPSHTTLIRVKNAYEALAKLLQYYERSVHPTGIEEPSYIAPTATLASDVYIGAFAYIAQGAIIEAGAKIYPHAYIGVDVCIGEHSVVYPGVKIYKGCRIGKHCIIHSGAVIGSDGFGFAPDAQGQYVKVPQMGIVVLGDHVEIGANTTIDRGTMGSTSVENGSKIDNLVQIAHNVQIGQNTVIAAQAGISGSTKVGHHVMIGGQAGLVGHITIADRCKINAQSGVSKSLTTPNSAVTGSPAWEYTKMLRAQALFKKLPEIWQRINDTEL